MNKDSVLLCGAVVADGIGVAGEQGFGVGVYPGEEADLTAVGLSPMDGTDDPSSDNYGNYVHTNGSVMVFIPAFAYRIGNASAPSYGRDTVNAIEIRSATDFDNFVIGGGVAGDMGGGWALHRAFIDEGTQKSGFFIDKYLCSKSDLNSNIAVSVKGKDPLQLTTTAGENNTTSGMTGCSGCTYDAITLSSARGSDYGCMTVFMFSALGMLSMSHGQAATSNKYCAWFDPEYKKNYPKGNNNSLKDVDDPDVTFVQSSSTWYKVSKTGSASDFSKCTHNGQPCGVYGVNGDLEQIAFGVVLQSSTSIYVLKDSKKFNVIKNGRYSTEHYDTFAITATESTSGINYWNPSSAMFYPDASGPGRALCGVYPKSKITTESPSNSLFGNDCFTNYVSSAPGTSYIPRVGGYYSSKTKAGVWCITTATLLEGKSSTFGFRAACYAK